MSNSNGEFSSSFDGVVLGITAVSVENFKSLVGEHHVEIRPLTILAGANNSGKSSIIQPLLLLKQTIADVGLGVSQVLPAIVALLVAEPGQLVYLEHPEVYLHPQAQIALATALADAAKRQVRVIVETHSYLLLLAIQTLVAEGYIAPDEVMFHWFKRRKNGATEISSAELDDSGAYGDWPMDFESVILKAENRYISAAEARLMARQTT